MNGAPAVRVGLVDRHGHVLEVGPQLRAGCGDGGAEVRHGLVDPINATAGLLVFCVALVVLELKKIELADYLPSLAFAPLLSWLWR